MWRSEQMFYLIKERGGERESLKQYRIIIFLFIRKKPLQTRVLEIHD
jgi:hypothetical protein